MDGTESFWFTTRSALRRGGSEGWEAIAAYAPSIARYLASRYPRLPEEEWDDLAQEILIEMRERLAPGHDPSRGRFRALLQTALKHRVIDRLRRRGAAERAGGLLDRFTVARARFPALESPEGAEFRRGLELVLS